MKLPTEAKPKSFDFQKCKFLIYGDPGSGKSTLASHFPNALFVPTEPGLNFLNCHQITNDDGTPKIIKSWDEFMEAIKMICLTEHKFKTIVIDTIDNAYEFCALHVLKQREIEHESDEGYGKGFNLIKREFSKVVNFIANSGFGLVFISHEKSGEREEKGVKRQWTDSSMPGGAKSYINGLVDFIFYCHMNDEGQRLMRTRSSLNINAKDRTGKLPEEMEMSFETLLATLNKIEEGT